MKNWHAEYGAAMPTYTVSTSPGQLDDAARPALARAITAAHTAATGVPRFFAQVRFEELEAGQHFVGGVPMTDDFVFVHGQIRSGRTPEQKRVLLDALVAGGYFPDRSAAFELALYPGSPYYIGTYAIDTTDAIRMVRQAGGRAVLAHPAASRQRCATTGALSRS